MKQFTLGRRTSIMCVLILMIFTALGRVQAWEISKSYEAGLNAKSWSPYTGSLHGDVYIDPNLGNRRVTSPYAQQVWNATAINWIKANTGVLSITFHSSYHGNTGPTGCERTTWYTEPWASSNLPAATWQRVKRNCSYTIANEIRISVGDKSKLNSIITYWAQSKYSDDQTSDGQFNVDTYWGGQENYHQKYCVISLAQVPTTCSW